jgi:hypothetical protein
MNKGCGCGAGGSELGSLAIWLLGAAALRRRGRKPVTPRAVEG